MNMKNPPTNKLQPTRRLIIKAKLLIDHHLLLQRGTLVYVGTDSSLDNKNQFWLLTSKDNPTGGVINKTHVKLMEGEFILPECNKHKSKHKKLTKIKPTKEPTVRTLVLGSHSAYEEWITRNKCNPYEYIHLYNENSTRGFRPFGTINSIVILLHDYDKEALIRLKSNGFTGTISNK